MPGAGVQDASDSFFGFDTSLPPEDSIAFGDGGLPVRPIEADGDADLDNDETFGGDLGDGAALPPGSSDAGRQGGEKEKKVGEGTRSSLLTKALAA